MYVCFAVFVFYFWYVSFYRFSFNPYSISACLARSTAVFNNIILLLALFYMLKGQYYNILNTPYTYERNFIFYIALPMLSIFIHALYASFRKCHFISSICCHGSIHLYVSHHSVRACGSSLFPGKIKEFPCSL